MGLEETLECFTSSFNTSFTEFYDINSTIFYDWENSTQPFSHRFDGLQDFTNLHTHEITSQYIKSNTDTIQANEDEIVSTGTLISYASSSVSLGGVSSNGNGGGSASASIDGNMGDEIIVQAQISDGLTEAFSILQNFYDNNGNKPIIKMNEPIADQDHDDGSEVENTENAIEVIYYEAFLSNCNC